MIDNDQPTPIPTQSLIVPSTPRTYWTGAISSWGVDLVKRGFTVTTNTAAFTYGNATNPLDLSNFDVLIVPEPNTLFSAAEASAILAFVHDGGGLIAVSDHDVSDRNNDGFDSPKIWNALDPGHLLGVHFGSTGDANNNIVQTSSNVAAAASDSITRGVEGNVPGLAFHNGTTLTLFPVVNATVRGEVWMTGVPQTSATGVMAASAQYGSGRVFFCGDSSPCDDGTANPGNSNIFEGWSESADSLLLMNATQWASRRDAATGDVTPPAVTLTSPSGGEAWDVASVHPVTWTASDNVAVDSVNVDWSAHGAGGPWTSVAHALANSGSYNWTLPAAPTDSALVRVTAFDHSRNSAGAESGGLFRIIDPNLGVTHPGPAVLALARPTPNPAHGLALLRFSLPAAGEARLEVLDLSGRRVWSRSASLAAGAHEERWDGRDDAGRTLGAGLYMVRLLTPWGTRGTRLAWVR